MSDIVLQHCCMSLKNFICIINCMIFFVNCSLMIIIVSFTYQHHNKLFTPVGFKNSSFEHFGERALMENKEQREIKSRLQRIEDELSKLHNPEEIEVTGRLFRVTQTPLRPILLVLNMAKKFCIEWSYICHKTKLWLFCMNFVAICWFQFKLWYTYIYSVMLELNFISYQSLILSHYRYCNKNI